MRFLVIMEVHNTIVLPDDDRRLRELVGSQIRKVLESGKVRESGFLGGRRAAFMLIDIDEARELYELFGPEIYSTCELKAYPVVPTQEMGPLFEAWAREGR